MDDQTAADTLKRHQVMAHVFTGEWPMSWEVWELFAYESTCLTPAGRAAALWATDQLRRALGKDFLDQSAKAGHGLILAEHWPLMNDVPWVLANLFELACQFHLFQKQSGKVLRSMRRNPTPDNWTHSLMQFELGGLGRRAGWLVAFEPELGTGRQADVHMAHGGDTLLVETRSMRESDHERTIQHAARRMGGAISLLCATHGVDITGSFLDVGQRDAMEATVRTVEAAAIAAAGDGRVRHVVTPGGGLLHIARNPLGIGAPNLEGPTVSSPVWDRLLSRLQEKSIQATGSAKPVWLRLDEYAGLFTFTQLYPMSLAERLNALASLLHDALQPHPSLAGIILAPSLWWTGDAAPERVQERVVYETGAIAVRAPLPGHRARETVIVPRSEAFAAQGAVFAEWYADEDTWLDWALRECGQPPFEALVHEP